MGVGASTVLRCRVYTSTVCAVACNAAHVAPTNCSRKSDGTRMAEAFAVNDKVSQIATEFKGTHRFDQQRKAILGYAVHAIIIVCMNSVLEDMACCATQPDVCSAVSPPDGRKSTAPSVTSLTLGTRNTRPKSQRRISPEGWVSRMSCFQRRRLKTLRR